MSWRTHLGLRLSGLLLLLIVAVWPRSRSVTHGRAVSAAAHLAVTTAARLDVDHSPRPRAPRPASPQAEAVVLAVDDPTLTN
jgi:hypothetical protein